MSLSDPTLIWNQLAQRAGARLDPDQHALLWRYIDLLLDANQRLNLTRIDSRDQAAILHVGDSLTLLPHLPATPHRLADVGSGGGVPGIPLAIMCPDVQVTLIESTKKKAKFLAQAIEQLELSNLLVDPRRVEDVARSDGREAFDIAVARAVASLDFLAEWCLPLVKVGGAMLAMKGPKVQDEIRAGARVAQLVGGGKIQLISVDLSGAGGHVIARIPKTRATPKQYPRPATHAKGKPLEL